MFSITKWPCSKYCLTGYVDGLRLAGPHTNRGLVLDASKSESCVELNVLEVPCSIRDASNNCAWKSSSNQCCGTVDCGGDAIHEEASPIVAEPEEPLPYCPTQHGTTRTFNGVTFEVICSAAYSTTNRQAQDGISDPDACVQACAADPECQGANWKISTSKCIKHYVYTGQPSRVNDMEDWFSYGFGPRVGGRTLCQEGDIRDFIISNARSLKIPETYINGLGNNLAHRLLETALEAMFVAESHLLTVEVL
ncbi:unnamed protein product [Penicillium viridicatum]